MKKALLVFAGILMISAMVFASGATQDSIASSAAAFNISVFHETGNHPQPNRNNPIYAYIEKELGVTFTWDILVGDIGQRRATMLAGNRFPDVIEVRGNEWIEAGALIPLEDLIDQYGPNIKKQYADVWTQMQSSVCYTPSHGRNCTKRHTYYLINYGVYQGADQDPNYNQTAFYIQKDILKQAGYPKVKTLDEYFNLIRNYYRANPTINGQPTIPFSILMDDWRAFELWNPPNFLAGNYNDGNGIVSMPGYVYQAFFTLDISKRWFQYLNGLYAEGLVDRTFATDTYDQYQAKLSAGRILGQSIQGWQFQSADNANRDRGQPERMMAPLAIVFDNSITPGYRNQPIPNLLRGMGISTSAQNPARIIQFINAFLEEKHQKTITWGIEGLHWQYGTNGVPYRTPDQRTNWQNQNWQELNRGLLLGDIFPKREGSYSDGYPTDLNFYPAEREATMLAIDKEIYTAYNVGGYAQLVNANPAQNAIWFPTWNMEFATPPAGSAAQIALTRMEETMKSRLPAIIMAPAAQFETLWAAYVAEMNANGLAAYNAHMQAELDKRLNGFGVTTPRR